MRRKDREVTDPAVIDGIIRRCDCCRLGFADGVECYIVPLSFGFANRDGKRVFYFHSAREGRKVDLARRCGRAGFELDAEHRLLAGDAACQCTMDFESVIGTGAVDVVEDPEEKREALQAILAQCTGREGWDLPDRSEQSVCILKLTVEELSCKVHKTPVRCQQTESAKSSRVSRD